ncbi:MAG: hypothetical protein K1X35_10900 [Caulobacteraceae bacterium]|nr:hypothetical protein [Caulobacteraceae bacterium]
MRLIGVLGAAMVFAASPAYAASGDCLWDSLAPQTREALLTAYRANPDSAFGRVRPTPEDQQAMTRNCGMTPANMLETLAVLKMTTLEKGAEAALRNERGVEASTLAGAWSGLAEADRAALLAAANAAIEGDEDTGGADRAIGRFMTAAGLPLTTSGVNQGLYWLRAHSMRLAYEGRTG